MGFKNYAKIACGLLAGAAFLVPTIAIADSRYEELIPDQLITAARYLGVGSYQLFSDPYIDTLTSDGEDRLTFTLTKGATYAIIGVCDEDCSDIDLELYDANGNSISVDRADDDYPIVRVTPAWTGQFSLEVDMYNCSASYCYYGIGIYRQ